MPRTRVKICGIVTPDMAEIAVDCGADAIGLVFTESRRRVPLHGAEPILRAIPAWVTPVAVLRRATETEIHEVSERTSISTLQMDHDSEMTAGMLDLAFIPVFRIGDGSLFDVDPFLSFGGVRLVEGVSSGTGTRIDWHAVAPLARQRRTILAGGLTPDNVAEAIRTVRPYGVDVSSGVESSPGKKDPIKIRDFLQAVRDIDRELQ